MGEPKVNHDYDHPFRSAIGRVMNAGTSRSLILTGNTQDLYYIAPNGNPEFPNGRYVDLTKYLCTRWQPKAPNSIFVIYEINGPIRFVNPDDRALVKSAWPEIPLVPEEEVLEQSLMNNVISRVTKRKEVSKPVIHPFDDWMRRALNKPAVALQMLRRFCELSRDATPGSPLYQKKFVILVEWAHMLIPTGEVARLNEQDRHRVTILQDWFSDLPFIMGKDTVILLTESRSMINQEISRLPMLLEIAVPLPDQAARLHFIEWFDALDPRELKLWSTREVLAESTGGLTLFALHKMLTESSYVDQETQEVRTLTLKDTGTHVETFIRSQFGDKETKFLRPTHTLSDVIGFTNVKRYLTEEVIPGILTTDPEQAITGMVFAGSIGNGKTFIAEALAGELGLPAMALPELRDKYFGGTDVKLQRFEQLTYTIGKGLLLMDEADKVLGGMGKDVHETEARLTASIQSLMSRPALRGKIVWVLMTARPHMLSPDMRRPGRGGDLIIPLANPEGADFDAFVKWTLKGVVTRMPSGEQMELINNHLRGHSSGFFDALRRKLRRQAAIKGKPLSAKEVIEYMLRQRSADIEKTRRYQELQALMNCTDTRLYPYEVTEKTREEWAKELRLLELQGIE